ncbi:Monothiol glutaredoxin-S14 chloroplastic, partial [Zea mays]
SILDFQCRFLSSVVLSPVPSASGLHNLAVPLLGAAVPGRWSDLKCSTGVTGHDAHRSLSLVDYGRLELDCCGELDC